MSSEGWLVKHGRLDRIYLLSFSPAPSQPPKWYAAVGLQVSRDINLFSSLGGGAGAGRAGKGQISRPWP